MAVSTKNIVNIVFLMEHLKKNETMEEMIESCIPFWLEENDRKTEEDARNKMREFFPHLKRWKK